MNALLIWKGQLTQAETWKVMKDNLLHNPQLKGHNCFSVGLAHTCWSEHVTNGLSLQTGLVCVEIVVSSYVAVVITGGAVKCNIQSSTGFESYIPLTRFTYNQVCVCLP